MVHKLFHEHSCLRMVNNVISNMNISKWSLQIMLHNLQRLNVTINVCAELEAPEAEIITYQFLRHDGSLGT